MKALLRKLRRLLGLGGAVAALTAAAAPTAGAGAPDTANPSATLKVQVNVPPSWDPLLDDDIAAAFTDQVREIFQRAGHRHPVEELRSVEDPAKAPYLLTVNLTEWRINRAGNIACTFGATLRTPQGERDLGLYTNTTMRWIGGLGRWGLARSFEEAAVGAIRNLCDTIARSELLPGANREARYTGLLREPEKPKGSMSGKSDEPMREKAEGLKS